MDFFGHVSKVAESCPWASEASRASQASQPILVESLRVIRVLEVVFSVRYDGTKHEAPSKTKLNWTGWPGWPGPRPRGEGPNSAAVGGDLRGSLHLSF